MNTDRVMAALQSRTARKVGISLGVVGGLLALLGLLVVLYGPVNTIAYVILFLLTATLLPVCIGLFGNAVPGSTAIGKLHIILGALAFDHHYLVERADRWEWCPGDRGTVYVDGEWYEIDGGLDNYSVLGWRPFGIIPFKDEDTWAEYRIDEKAKSIRSGTVADGGTHDTERAGWTLREPPVRAGIDTWVLDLKRIYSSGVRKIGDISLIETAEEVIERGQVQEERVGQLSPWIQTSIGIVMGVLAAALYVGVM